MLRKAGFQEVLLLGAQSIVSIDPIAFKFGQLFRDALPLDGCQT